MSVEMNDTTAALAALCLEGKKEVNRRPSPTSVDRAFSSSDMPIGFHENKYSSTPDSSKSEQVSKSEMEQRKKLDSMLEKLSQQLEEQEIIAMPPQLQHVKLFKHQLQGISWLVKNETSKAIPSFWKKVKHGNVTKWRCSITGALVSDKPKHINGSILADEMGLGKTLQSVGLILANPPKGQTYPYDESKNTSKPRTTLIISPVSVMANWKLQVNNFVNTDKKDILNVELFYGTDREKTLLKAQDNKVDILLTSYHTLMSEMKLQIEYQEKVAENEERIAQGKRPRHKLQKDRTFVFDVDFHRIILDESHEIRNPGTWFFKAACRLQAKYKLCLTGTPFVNRPSDIGSLLTFLGVAPLSSPDCFQEYITDPIRDLKEVGLARLRTTMAHVTLRRSKELVEETLNIPSKEVQIRTVALTDGAHKDILELFFETTKACIIGLLQLGAARQKLGSIFGLLVRVRQACCHLELVPASRRALVQDVAETMKERGVDDLSTPEGIVLLEKLIGDLQQVREEEDEILSSDEESELDYSLLESDDESEGEWESDNDKVHELFTCESCADILDDETAIVLGCDHVFCYECLDPDGGRFCPNCKVAYTLSDLNQDITLGTPMKKKRTPAKKSCRRAIPMEQEVVIDVEDHVERSPKIQALLDAIEAEMQADEKAVIFSQWTSFLDIIQDEFDSVGHTYCRIDGSMNAEARIVAMEKFATQGCDSMKTPRFVLCSLRACNTGINLTRGNVVFILDPWWNVAAEEQAMDRVHRIGQTREVKVIRLVMKDSIEERMVELQKAKAALGKGSLQKITPQERRKAKLTFLRDLFDIAPAIWDTDRAFVDDGDWISEEEIVEDVDDDEIWL